MGIWCLGFRISLFESASPLLVLTVTKKVSLILNGNSILNRRLTHDDNHGAGQIA
jgi:hypothetical protein